jgi:aminoglycoside/choline kinase family phosphotransferase
MTAAPGADRRVADFIEACGWGAAERRPLAGDASSRRYERLVRPGGASAILMDSPAPEREVIPFLAVADLLRGIGMSVPATLGARAEEGLLLLEDFGDATFSRLLDAGEDPGGLYALGTDALVEIHRRFDPALVAGALGAGAEAAGRPRYDADLFVGQVGLFLDEYLPHALGRPASAEERAGFEAAWRAVVPGACAAVPSSLLLRDYHVDNLMRLDGRPGAAACGILDFELAGPGPVSYDLASLLEDARRDVPDPLKEAMLRRYLDAFPGLDEAAFRASFAVMGAVRHARVLAVFARLWLRQGRGGYLVHMPRVWRLLEAQLARPELVPVRGWFDRHLPPGARAPLFVPRTER